MTRGWAVSAGFALAIAAACGGPVKDPLVQTDAAPDVIDAQPTDAAPDVDTTIGGPCTDDGQCNDQIDCTHDACDLKILRCRNVPDDTLCDDGQYCNGLEVCKKTGCAPGPVVACSTQSACDIDSCDEAQKICNHAVRDVDGDGDPDDHCSGGHDCDDANPAVSSLHSEICNNGVDDNCNGSVDEQPCVVAQNATCATALAIASAGTYALSTVGAPKTFTATCSVTNPNAAHDVVALVTVPSGPNVDLDVWADGPYGETAVAIFGQCGQPASELACGASYGTYSTRARARNVAPGTYTVVVTSSLETSALTLSVDFLTPAAKATNEDCGTAASIAINTPTTVSIIDAKKDLPDACGAQTGELTYSLTLAQAQDVRVYASTLRGSGNPVVGIRAPTCTGQTDELRCRNGSALPAFARNLQGTYFITVAGTSLLDANILVELSAPTTPPADQSCSTSPSATINATMSFDLSGNEDAIHDGCMPGGPTASFDVELSTASDVMVVARLPQTDVGAVSFDTPGCTTSDRLVCWEASTPIRVSKRNVAAGSYRAVVVDDSGQQGTLTTLVRDTVTATQVSGGDDCNSVVDIPSTGGYFYGDTSTHNADFDDGCDYGGVPPGGAPDQILRLVLAQQQRVVLNMDGSVYPTILSLRQGATCPGTEIACNFSFSGPRSFLDETLAAGTYYIVIDGYDLNKGAWDLDVRVIAP
jgi:hypothetical protein